MDKTKRLIIGAAIIIGIALIGSWIIVANDYEWSLPWTPIESDK